MIWKRTNALLTEPEGWRPSSSLLHRFPTASIIPIEVDMATYVSLVNFTDQGMRNVKDTTDRLAAFKATAEKLGVSVRSAYYTVGKYDIILTLEGSDEAVTTAQLKVGSLGNVRTQTLRAFSPEEMKAMLGKLP
jgi:uncharacterized protein with GYD domain